MPSEGYREKIRKLAKERVNEVFFNADTEHAVVVLSELIKNAEQNVFILCKDMNPAVTDSPEYLNSISNFLKCEYTGAIKILVSDLDQDIFKKSKIANILRKYPGKFEIKSLDGKKVKSCGEPINFTVSDGRAFRFESDIEKHIAFGNFNDVEGSKILEARFNEIFNNKQWNNVSI